MARAGQVGGHLMSLFSELKRRNVFRVGIGYAVMAWLILQVADVVLGTTDAPGWVMKVVLFCLAAGVLPVLAFAWVFELTPEGLKRERDIPRGDSVTHVTAGRLDLIIIGLLVVALGLFVWESRTDREPAASGVAGSAAAVTVDPAPARETDDAAPGIAAPEGSIAVLPFVNLSSDPEQEYFSDGISEELLNVLAQYPNLHVAARTSSFQFKGQNQDVGEIARLLKVRHVLEGSVRKAGTRLRITAQLIEANTGYHLWSETYDRELDDVFAIQDEISAAIGDALRVELALEEQGIAAAPRVAESANTAAYEAYLRGRHQINQRGRSNIVQAVEDLKRAVRLDPEFAPGHAWLAIGWALLLDSPATYGDLPLTEVRERAVPHIEKALALNPNLAEAHGARGLLALNSNDYALGAEATAKALELNPVFVDAMNWRAITATNLGDYATGLQMQRRIVEADPLSVVGRLNYSLSLAATDLEAGRAMARDIVAQHAWAGYAALGAVEVMAGRNLSGGLGWFLRAYGIDPRDELSNRSLMQLLSQVGEFEEARRISDGNLHIADLYEGRFDEAIEILQREAAGDPENYAPMSTLAQALHLAGRFEESQALYAQLRRVLPNGLVVDNLDLTTRPMIQMAYAYRLAGDEDAAAEALAVHREDMAKRVATGVVFYTDYVAMAVARVVEDDADGALTALRTAMDMGWRDPLVLREPCLQKLGGDPRFAALKSELEQLIAADHAKVLQLICHDNPIPTVWQPRKETCQRAPAGDTARTADRSMAPRSS
jgi:TolB-like protein/Flp pilus assembly protein TadD